MNIIARFKSLPISARRQMSLGMILGLLVGLPLFVYALLTGRFLFQQKAASGEPPGTVPLYISEQFTGPGALDPSKWNWSGSVGTNVGIFNNELEVTVPAGHDGVGGNDAVVQALVNYQIPTMVGNFTASVDMGAPETTNGWEELKFAPGAAASIRRAKVGSTQTIEGWTSPDNANWTKVASFTLPAGTGPVNVSMSKSNNDIFFYYDLGDTNGAGSGNVLLFQTQMTDTNTALPRLVVENGASDYPQTTGFFDNFVANGFMLPIPTATATPISTPTPPPPGARCGLCGGIAGISCQAGLTCYYQNRTRFPDQSGICIDQRGPSFCGINPSPTPPVPGGECQACGGFTGATCQAGLICQQFGIGIPERPGICVKRDGSSTCGRTPTPAPTKFIRVLTPNGGETIVKGNHYTINWQANGISSYLIYLIDNKGNSSLINGASAPATSYDWVANSPMLGTQFKIRIVDASPGTTRAVSDTSDNFFNLVSQPPPTVRPFVIKLKLQGVTDDSASYAKLGNNAAKVAVKFLSSTLNYAQGFVTSPVMVDYAGSGIYNLHFGIWSTELPASNDYSIILKGEKHIAIKFCSPFGQISHCTGTGNIIMPVNPSETVNLDFTGIPLPPGDLYPQDGTVTTLGTNSDLARLLLLLAKNPADLTQQDLLTGDLNYDGKVDIRDLYLFRLTLQTRYDEN